MVEYLDTWSKKRSTGKLSITQQLQLVAMRPPVQTKLIGGLDPTKLARFPDTSHWNGRVDVKLMAPFIDAIMAKCSDGKQVIAGSVNDLNTYVDDQFAFTVQSAYDAHRPVIAYHYWQPDHNPASKKENDRQYQALLYSLKSKPIGKSVHEIRIDLEEKSTYHHTIVKNNFETLWYWLVEDFGERCPLSVYTSVGYLESVPALRDFLLTHDIEIHYAQWVFNVKTRVTWNQAADRVKTWNMKVLNYEGWLSVQLTSSFFGMEGCGEGEIDYNVHSAGRSALWNRLKFVWDDENVPDEPDPEPDPDPEPTGDYATRAEFDALSATVATLSKRVDEHTHATGAPL